MKKSSRVELLSLLFLSLFFSPMLFAKKGIVQVDGSSTVYPITAAVAEEFQAAKEHRGIRVTVAYSGTGGGFKKWCKGETDINDASRTIKSIEKNCATKSGIKYIELPVAYDGLSVVVSKRNTFLNSITTAQLKKLWEPGSKVTQWNQLDPKFPAKRIKLYGPGHDSGTFDYFTEVINHKARASRTKNVVTSEDDNALVKGVSASPFALGYFGFAYFVENQSRLRAVPVDGGKGPVTPTTQSIETGKYSPLSRPVYIYVSSKAVARPEVQAFVRFYLKNARSIVESVRYIPMPEVEYQKTLAKFNAFAKKVAE